MKTTGYTVKLYWNDKLVLEGKGSMVTCFETALDFMRRNFVGTAHTHYVDGQSRRLSELQNFNNLSMAWADDTGSASAVVERVFIFDKLNVGNTVTYRDYASGNLCPSTVLAVGTDYTKVSVDLTGEERWINNIDVRDEEGRLIPLSFFATSTDESKEG